MRSDLITEEWRPVVGYEAIYSVSSLGRVRRDARGQSTYPGRILGGGYSRKGYRYVGLCTAGRTKLIKVHQLAAAAFLGPCPKGKQVNHRDGNKPNNAVGNLEYMTPSENTQHGFRLGLISNAGERHPGSKLTDSMVRAIRQSDKSPKELAQEYGVHRDTIWDARHRSWQHLTS